jgi:flagellar assembly protein FliH
MLQEVRTKIQRMEYRTIPIHSLMPDASAGLSGNEVEESARAQAELEEKLKEMQAQHVESERSFQSTLKAVRTEAYEEGRKSQHAEQSERLAKAADHFKDAVGRFWTERDRYLTRVEQEVVRLALAIAARILHREAQMDPLLLTGAVRVALGQLVNTTEVHLRVPADEQEMWADMLRLMPNLPVRPQLTPDDTMKAGECTLETHLGSVDLGVKAQLAEIERGFFDLLEYRDQMAVTPQLSNQQIAGQ